MRSWNMSRSIVNPLIAGVGVIVAVAGCSKASDNNPGMLPNPSTGAGVGGTGTPTAGTGTSTAGSIASPMGGGMTAPPVGTAGGGGTMPPMGTAGTVAPAGSGGGMPPEGGDGGGGTGGTPGGLDTSGFLENCLQGGAQWGTPQQTGPCKSGDTIYGVHTEFGPYGVRSKINVGQGFETGGTDDSVFCNTVFIPSFGADPVGSADLMNTHDLDFALFTVFYPGIMPEGEKFPLITWGNGTCAMPEGYGPLLRYVASFGYIIIAANNREVGSGLPMTLGIDFMFAENEKQGSEFFGHVDTDKVGAMGHSQGGGATIAAADDPRVKAVIIWNGGTSASKPFLAVSGDRDLGGTVSQMSNAANAAPRPAAWIWYHQVPAAVNGSTTGQLAPGHLTLMMESERVIEPAVAWWDMILKGKAEAKPMFVGDSCTLCDGTAYPSMWVMPATPPSLEYGHNSMVQ